MAVLLASPPYAGYQINNLIRQKDFIAKIKGSIPQLMKKQVCCDEKLP